MNLDRISSGIWTQVLVMPVLFPGQRRVMIGGSLSRSSAQPLEVSYFLRGISISISNMFLNISRHL